LSGSDGDVFNNLAIGTQSFDFFNRVGMHANTVLALVEGERVWEAVVLCVGGFWCGIEGEPAHLDSTPIWRIIEGL
jgi:hypothetical protein